MKHGEQGSRPNSNLRSMASMSEFKKTAPKKKHMMSSATQKKLSFSRKKRMKSSADYSMKKNNSGFSTRGIARKNSNYSNKDGSISLRKKYSRVPSRSNLTQKKIQEILAESRKKKKLSFTSSKKKSLSNFSFEKMSNFFKNQPAQPKMKVINDY
jgi:hypothetical protein